MNYTNNLFNRVMATILAVIMIVACVPLYVFAGTKSGDVPDDTVGYATVKPLTGGTVTGSGEEEVSVIVEETTLEWAPADESIGRLQDGWWAGIEVTAPDGAKKDLATVRVKSDADEEFGEALSFATVKDTEDTVGLWLRVTPEILDEYAAKNNGEGSLVQKWYQLDWDGDGVCDQTITFSVKPGTKIVLMKDGFQAYPYAAVEPLTGGDVAGNKTSEVTVSVDEATLVWHAADESIGRYQDGWWVGVNVTAPAGINNELANIRVKNYSDSDFGEALIFDDVKDTANSVGVWLLITPAIIEEFAAKNDGAGSPIEKLFSFDWDGNGEYEQELTISVDPKGNIVLVDKDAQVYPYGKVETYTGGVVVGDGSSNVSVVVDEATLEWAAADESIDRPKDGWWAGIKVTAPKGVDVTKVSYRVKTTGEYSAPASFEADKNGDDYLDIWQYISPEKIEKYIADDKPIKVWCQFDWDGNDEFEQEITFTVNPNGNIVLMKDGAQAYPYGTVDTYTGGTVADNGSSNVSVVVDDVTLEWAAADESIDRPVDGWWAGIKVTAPAGVDASKVSYRYKTDAEKDYSDAASFNDDKTGADYIDIWQLVTPEKIEKCLDEDKPLKIWCEFDWDGNDEYEQEITFELDLTGNIVLMKEGFQAYPYGSVEAITGGDVTGSTTANVTVEVDETTLEWAAADENIGRLQDGWWVGIDVTAPEGTKDDLAFCRVKTYSDEKFGDALSFGVYKDTENTISLWTLVTPEMINEFAAKGESIKKWFQFDWDGNGDFEQEITVVIDPNGDIVLNKGEDQIYPDEKAPEVSIEMLTEKKYNNEPVSAIVSIIERIEGFNAEKATESISVKDAEGNVITDGYEISGWYTAKVSEEYALDQYVHTATVTFNASAEYVLDVEYADLSGNVGNDVAAESFIVDYEAPSADIKVEGNSIIRQFVDTLTFGIFSNDQVVINIEDIKDDFSDRDNIKVLVYKSSDTEAIDPKKVKSWGEWDGNAITMTADDLACFYVMLIDEAGNTAYLSSEGVIVEDNEGTITITPNGAYKTEGADKYLYNAQSADFTVDVRINEYIEDKDIYSGIKEIKYWFNNYDEMVGDIGYLYAPRDSYKKPTYEALMSVYEGTEVIDIKKHFEDNGVSINSCNIELWIQVTDNAGNVYADVIYIDVDTEAPVIDVEIIGQAKKHAIADNFESVTANITITEREDHFNADVALEAIMNGIVAYDNIEIENAAVVEDAFEVSDWTHNDGNTIDGATHSVTVTFNKDAKYVLNIGYTDDFENEGVAFEDEFVKDIVKPTGDILYNENSIVRSLFNILTFGVFENEQIRVDIIDDDELSGVQKVLYYDSDTTYALDDVNGELDFDALEDVIEWQHADEKFAVFAKDDDEDRDDIAGLYVLIIDNAGNLTYLNSKGIIIEDNDGVINILPENETTYEDAAGNTVYAYNQDTESYKVDLYISEFENDTDVYSGIKEVKYWVNSYGEMVGDIGYIYPARDSYKEPIYDTLLNELDSRERNIPAIDLKQHFADADVSINSSEIELWVQVEDNAGNVYKEMIYVDVDTMDPEIRVTYENKLNSTPGHEETPVPEHYSHSKATVVITERADHFDALKATDGIVITATDIDGAAVEANVIISEWTPEINEADPDLTTHTATIEYFGNANYTFDITYTDELGNNAVYYKADDEIASDDYEADAFVVDNDEPYGTVYIDDVNFWDELINILTFGLWSNEGYTVNVKDIGDDTSKIYITEYVKLADTVEKTETELDAIDDWEKYPVDGVPVANDEIATVYVKITDFAGKYKYISTNGMIVENDGTNISFELPGKAGTYNHPIKGDVYYYNNPGALNSNDYDVNIKLKDNVSDNDIYSGINYVEYSVSNYGVPVGETYIWEYNVADPTFDQLVPELEFVLNLEEHLANAGVSINSSEISVNVKTIDNAGNKNEQTIYVDIDTIDPTIDVSYEDVDTSAGPNVDGYYQKRTATVTITERADHFIRTVANDGITITAKNFAGEDVTGTVEISDWTPAENESDPDLTTHTMTIVYNGDANYTFDVEFTDKLGNAAANYAGDVFTVDNSAPEGTVTAQSRNLGTEEDLENVLIDETWDDIATGITFDLWTNAIVDITGASYDATAGVQCVDYYKTASVTAMTTEELAALAESEWTSFDGFEVTPNEQLVVYVRIIDNAGNVKYISTNGIIVDDMDPAVRKVLPNITVTPEQPVNGIYNGDVTVAVEVVESQFKDVYSGLNKITYVVKNMGVETQSGTLYDYDKTGALKTDLRTEWSDEHAITVLAAKNNSNDVVIEVYAVDNAGNSHKATAAVKIDTTAPVIDITYDNNNGDKSYSESVYYKENRTATIVITERNFDPNDVLVTITNTDGTIPTISAFTTVQGDGNGDGTKHTAQIVYSADGDYTFNIAYTDEANNRASEINHLSEASTAFTIDKTIPVVTVSFDNMQSNGVYFNASRTATIVVTEHNFDPARFVVDTMGQAMSGWSSNGDIHTATISYNSDMEFKLDFECSDKAGNAIADFTPVLFTIDTEFPVVDIVDNILGTTVEDYLALNGDVSFNIVYSDKYVDANKVTVKLENSEGKDLTDKITVQNKSNDGHTVIKLIEDTLEQSQIPDGIYTLTVTVYDLAGNATSLPKTFSVNRNASNYVEGDALKAVIDAKYNEKITENLIISAINCTEITETVVTIIRDGTSIVLTEGVDYTITAKTYNPGSWFQYDIEINADVFSENGNYSIVIKTVDKAGNTVDNLTTSGDYMKTIEFTVDDIDPVVMISGVGDGPYNATSINAVIGYEDNVGMESVIVTLKDSRGDVIGVPSEYYMDGTEYDGKALSALADDFKYSVGSNIRSMTITVDAVDKAGNEIQVVSDEFIVSPNFFVRNASLLIIIASVVVVIAAAAIVVIIILKKKKQNGENK